ncbi:MAG: GTPase HflX [Anaerovoracaceae bacterium]|nr:GTPase HflX [Anaerovoracaceae bacterium]
MVKFDEDNNVVTKDSFRAILVGVETTGSALSRTRGYRVSYSENIDDSMDELKSLTEAVDGIVLGKVVQNLDKPNSATFIGSGKVLEIADLVKSMEADTVIFNDELSGMQIRNLEDALGIKVIDRTILIMDIFAGRASSKVGKLQVELAQLRYRLPRLVGFGRALSRLGGGIGTRGPGEKKMETDRRHVKKRIDDILRELAEAEKTRQLQREKRSKADIPIVALVGYTNVGKSAIMNYMIKHFGAEDKQVEEKDMLFATLDAKHRLIKLDNRREFILVDTVGFVSRLSHHLVEAFKGTLEEAKYADLIVQVEDISGKDMDFQREILKNVMEEIGIADKPRLVVLNKVDKLPVRISEEKDAGGRHILISAKTGENMDRFVDAVAKEIFESTVKLCLIIPYERGDIASRLCDSSEVLDMKYEEDGIHMTAMLKQKEMNAVKEFIRL